MDPVICYTFVYQALKSCPMDQLGSFGEGLWASLSLCMGRKKRVVLCTNRLSQGRCQWMPMDGSIFCTGDNTPPLHPPPIPRSGDEWWIGEMGDPVPEMKASVGAVADRPPATGWKCFDPETEEYLEDPSLTCNIFVSSSPCCLTISLSGRAKQVQSKCEGEYKSTGLFKAGRLVKKTEEGILA